MTATAEADFWSVEAAAPHQILTRTELHALGVTQSMIWVRVRPGGPWRRVLPGVIMLRNGEPTASQRYDATLRYARAGAVITGLAGARLHGLRRFPASDQVHVLIPHERKRATTGIALVERTTRPPTTVKRDGFTVANATRAVLDATRRMRKRDRVEALLAEAVQRGFTSPGLLRRELEEGSGRGSALARAVLATISRGARSPAECDGMRLVTRSRLPEPMWNPELRTGGGARLPTPDGWFDEVALAWEIDSLEFHLSPVDYDRTLRRHAAFTAAGITVLHTLPSRLRTEPDAVIAELRAAYFQASLRPRPDLIAIPPA